MQPKSSRLTPGWTISRMPSQLTDKFWRSSKTDFWRLSAVNPWWENSWKSTSRPSRMANLSPYLRLRLSSPSNWSAACLPWKRWSARLKRLNTTERLTKSLKKTLRQSLISPTLTASWYQSATNHLLWWLKDKSWSTLWRWRTLALNLGKTLQSSGMSSITVSQLGSETSSLTK